MEVFYDQDVFISYRHNDNRSGWVSAFVNAFQEELATVSKRPITIYFDNNPDNGLHDSHHVDKSLEQRLRCAVFVPILSQTYCDPKSFAWTNELCAFHRWVQGDRSGKYVKLNNGNVVSRILPVRIHELEDEDEQLFESETGEIMRSIDFIYKSAGVNRPLRVNEEHPDENQYQTIYRDQINKLALAVKEILGNLKTDGSPVKPLPENQTKVKSAEPYRVNVAVADEPSSDEKLLKNLQKAVEDNLSNELYSVEDLAEAVAYSRSYLHRKLQRLTGMSISQFIRGIRLQHALELLKKDVGTVSEIAYRVGFNSNTYFTKCFSEHFGYTPGEVKNRTAVPVSSAPSAPTSTPAPQSTPLEALHPAAAETLIREIFDSLVVHKPELGKFLLVNEDEGERLDIRLLAYQTIKSYPYIIGIELRRLFSGRLLEDEERYQQIYKTIDHSVKLLAYVLFSELIDKLHEGNLRLSAGLSKKISACLQLPDIANLAPVMEEINEILKENTVNFFVEELPSTFDEAFFRELNEVSRLTSGSESSEWTVADKSRSLEQALITILKKLAFLVRYRFVNVDSIEVNKVKFKAASFEHHLHILNTTDSEFKIHKEQLPEFSDSHAVLLMKSIREPNQFLNLSPFIIDTHTERKETVGNYKKDIYLFTRSSNGDAFYSGIESGSEEDLAFLEHRQSLTDLFNVTLNLIGK